MKQKDIYTLEELYTNLDISLSKLSKIAGVTEPTTTRIRDGYSARRETVNRLLKGFSEVYGIELSLDNVTGITLEDKKAIRKQMLERKGLTEKAEKPSVPPKVVRTPREVTEKAKKRTYKARETGLPQGCILASEFGLNHGIARETMRDHMNRGLGPGLIHGPDVPKDGRVLVRDYLRYEEREKRIRKDGTKEMERYLTQELQKQALEFWKRHNVGSAACNNIGCWCHTIKNGE